MSTWHSNTKTVRTYGKQRNRVVKVLIDLTDSSASTQASTPGLGSSSSSSLVEPNSPNRRAPLSRITPPKAVLQDKNGRPGPDEKRKGEEDKCGLKKQPLSTSSTKAKTLDSKAQSVSRASIREKSSKRPSTRPTWALRGSKEDAVPPSDEVAETHSSTSPSDASRLAPVPAPTTISLSSGAGIKKTVTRSSRLANAKGSASSSTRRGTKQRTPSVSSDSESDIQSAIFVAPASTTRVKRCASTQPSKEETEVEKDEDEQALPDALSALSLSASSTITPLGRLLEACGQDTPLDFSDLLANRTFFPPSVKTRPTTRKIGEATYSEVFAVDAGKSGQVVMKIIPLLSDEEALRTGKTVEERSENGESESESAPTLSDPRDVAREVELGRIVGSLDGFCTLHGAHVVKGVYPKELLSNWDAFAAENPTKTENVRPSVFDAGQRFAILLLAHGGVDLDSFTLGAISSSAGPWSQCAGIFWSVALSLARAEETVRFEHRDLHLGQILVRPSLTPKLPASKLATGPFDTTSGLETTIIDFGLSRVDAPGSSTNSWWTPFEAEVFEGKGRQWDVYRSMRTHLGADWPGFHPFTNVLWLRYLLQTLSAPLATPLPPRRARTRLSVGGGFKPVASAGGSSTAAAETRERAACECMKSVKKELDRIVRESMPARDGQEVWDEEDEEDEEASARSVVDWGRERGWCS